MSLPVSRQVTTCPANSTSTSAPVSNLHGDGGAMDLGAEGRHNH
jgi:hypothetical protein